MKKPVFKGCATALITPFQSDGSVHFEEIKRILDFQIENGIDAVVACGTTGESATLRNLEHIAVIERTVQYADGRVPVIAGTGSNDTAQAIMMSQKAQEVGADALLLVTPYYNKTSQAGLIRHYLTIADAVSIPMILYNVPPRTGMTIEPATYRALAAHPNIVATKEASGNFSAIATAMELCGDKLGFYSGNDDQIVPMISLGGLGVISVLSNIKPRETADLTRTALRGDFAAASEMQLRLMPLVNALFDEVNPIPVKEGMNLLGFDAGACRMPLCRLSDEKRAKLAALLA